MQAFTVEQVRAARAFLGWSQRELSEASGLSYETIHNFENSLNSATAQTLAAGASRYNGGLVLWIFLNFFPIGWPQLNGRIRPSAVA